MRSTAAGELERRERRRGDRPTGLAASQTGVHAHGDNDLAVDTTDRTAADCAQEIVTRLATLTHPKAFARLRAR